MAPSFATMKEAAQAFSRILSENSIAHAFIGGFAVNTLGHNRSTLDVDVEVDVDAQDLKGVIKLVCETNSSFVINQLKLLFVPNDWDSPVPFETLPRGLLNLPRRLLISWPGDGTIPILKPGILILTKIKRCAQYIGSTRPQSVLKMHADIRDIVYVLGWLNKNQEKIDFVGYDTGSPQRLYEATRAIRKHWIDTNGVETARLLDSLLERQDRLLIMGTQL